MDLMQRLRLDVHSPHFLEFLRCSSQWALEKVVTVISYVYYNKLTHICKLLSLLHDNTHPHTTNQTKMWSLYFELVLFGSIKCMVPASQQTIFIYSVLWSTSCLEIVYEHLMHETFPMSFCDSFWCAKSLTALERNFFVFIFLKGK